jgi:phosphoribosylamine--glycine ligase
MIGVDGAILPLATSQDHKARDDGDQGPNTGGMGAYSPAPVVTDAIAQRVINEVLRPVIEGMREEGVRYTGFLYAGLMIGPDGTPKVLEFNCRFGDPETQVVLPRLESDLVEICLACAEGRLAPEQVRWKPDAAVTVVLASGGYPGSYGMGKVIVGLDEAALTPGVLIFHAGTRWENDRLLTSGGRVLNVTALAPTLEKARTKAYEAVSKIHFEGMHFRKDIADLITTQKRGAS